jgi:hypothetical protein
MQVTLTEGIKLFRLEDVYRYEEYLCNGWNERAFLFRDGSILWETMAFSTYAADGSKFSTRGHAHHNGAEYLPGRVNGAYPEGMVAFIAEIKRVGRRLIHFDSQAWDV